ncbi:hypothetical protein BDV06DRAFT_228421 [Aspergillus oleicola]
MSFRAITVLALLPYVSAIAFPSASPTLISTIQESSTSAPATTPPALLVSRQRRVVRRQDDDLETVSYWSTDDPAICGWENAGIDNYQISCGTTETCVKHTGGTEYPGMIGCCSAGTSCYFATTCLDASKISASPELTDTQGPFTSYCTDPEWPVCATYTYSDLGVTDYICDATASLVQVFTSAFDDPANGTIDRWDLIVSTADDNQLDDYVKQFSTASQKPLGTASESPEATPTDGSDADANNDDDSSSNTGAIVGGVVGGVAGLAAIAVAGFFLWRFRQRKGSPVPSHPGVSSAHNPGPKHEYQYQSVPETKSPQPEYEMSPPAEMESSDPVHRIPEVQGDNTMAELPEPFPARNSGFVAELPADFQQPYRPTPINK